MREQVCTYMCPWPRIQAALTDEEALNVTYRVDRGEPRGPHKKNESWQGRGDCIDCKACVAACPMGIDIREGAQLECIGCALCIDACDEIMVKIDRPKGLIAYDTDLNIQRRMKGEKPRFTFLRPRVVLYAALIVGVAGLMVFGLASRAELELNSGRDRNPNYVTLSDGTVRNGYTITILNKANEARTFEVAAQSDPLMGMRIIGAREETPTRVTVGPDMTQDYRVFLSLPEAGVDGPSEAVRFTVTDIETGETADSDSVFQTGDSR